MVDRVERPDSPLYRVLETDKSGDEGKRQHQGEEEDQKKKDAFGQKQSWANRPWEKVIAKPANVRSANPLLTSKEMIRAGMNHTPEEEEDKSWTWRLKHAPLVALGVIDLEHRPRWGMIATYLLGICGVVVSLTLLIRLIN
ncbi:MAG: hypothetical protein HYS22_08505 [Deltaproteobacteria bacterium]|nr:hypothetical protein [Deltaproteobacteria bacterium]